MRNDSEVWKSYKYDSREHTLHKEVKSPSQL